MPRAGKTPGPSSQSPFPSSTGPVWHWPGVLGSQFSKGSLRLAEGEAAGLALLR